jgi:hypothetical protein
VTNITIAGQRLAKHVPEHYAVNKNRCPLLDTGFGICIAARTCIPVITLAKHVGYSETDMRSHGNRYMNHRIERSVRTQLKKHVIHSKEGIRRQPSLESVERFIHGRLQKAV